MLAWNRIFTTSVGWAHETAMAPVVQPAKIRVVMLESGEERQWVSALPPSTSPGRMLCSVELPLPDACLFC